MGVNYEHERWTQFERRLRGRGEAEREIRYWGNALRWQRKIARLKYFVTNAAALGCAVAFVAAVLRCFGA